MKNKILTSITIIGLIFSLFGCQQNNAIIKPDVETKTVTENSQLDLVTFIFDLPDNWTSVAVDKSSLICRNPLSNESEEYKNYISPSYVVISKYTTDDITPVSYEYIESYENLFKGKHDGIEKIINENIGYINISKYLENQPEQEFDSTYSIIDYFNILAEQPTVTDNELSEYFHSKVWASDFKYAEYQGKNGKVIAVEYSYVIDDKTHKAINCYRDDNYSVCGAFDDGSEFSSGDVALWIANTLDVSEHYRLEDGVVLIEGKDY